MARISIPFNKPYLAGQEFRYIREVIEGGHISGDGAATRWCHQWFRETIGAAKTFLTTSCTHALEISALLLRLKPGDEVIVPSFTFVTSANAFVVHGARPVFVDVRPDTLNLDETRLEAAITPRTRAIVVVHYAGVACDMDPILRIARERKIPVIEDNAHGLLGRYKGRNLGTLGALATQSFHETKNVSCGEGGALLINDESHIERAEIIREKGTDRSRFFRGEVDKYSWCDLGSSYLPSDILAAYLRAQLEEIEHIQGLRRKIWERYHAELADWTRDMGVARPTIPEGCEQSYHMYYLLLPSLADRKKTILALREAGAHAVFHYLPLHLSTMGRKFGGAEGDCPVTEDICDRLLRLPFYNELSERDQTTVINALLELKL